jgi:hypothetical protein
LIEEENNCKFCEVDDSSSKEGKVLSLALALEDRAVFGKPGKSPAWRDRKLKEINK